MIGPGLNAIEVPTMTFGKVNIHEGQSFSNVGTGCSKGLKSHVHLSTEITSRDRLMDQKPVVLYLRMEGVALDAIHDNFVRMLWKEAVAYLTVTKYARSAQFFG
jgi:hypothetical protein